MSIAVAEVEAAARRLAGWAVRTPLIESPALNDRLGRRVLVKAETLQRAGAFKFRGAFNRLSQLPDDARRRGVVAFSSGNHAQGVALAARLLDMPAVIVMPRDAPAVKAEATRGYGAEVRFYDRMSEDREAIAAEIADATGAAIVPAFDDPDVIAGQGTVGLELVAQARDLGVDLAAVLTPVGGGGLISGVSIAVKARAPEARIYGVEPAGYDDTLRSLQAGQRVTLTPSARTLCDALESPAPGKITFPIIQANVSGVAVVGDAEVAAAVRYAFATLKLVVEPGGAVGLAALLAGRLADLPSGAVALVLSGGNVDPELFGRIIRGEL